MLYEPVGPALEAYFIALRHESEFHSVKKEAIKNADNSSNMTIQTRNKLLQALNGCNLLSDTCRECIVEVNNKYYIFSTNNVGHLSDIREIKFERLKEKK